MGIALNRLAQEDPSFALATPDHESGQTIIKGMGRNWHLNILVDRMKREFKVEAKMSATPQGGLPRIPRPRG